MSTIDVSMEPMLDMFLFETNTLLEQLDSILLEAEKDASLSEENINEIFRTMHTIKGSAAMMGLDSISSLAHKVEDMFYIIRENPEKLKGHSEIFDIVFQSSDFLRSEVDRIPMGNYEPGDASELISNIKMQIDLLNGVAEKPEQVDNQPPSASVNAPSSNNSDLHTVRIFFEDGCQMENLRAFMVFSQLQELCEHIESDPPHPEADSSSSQLIAKNGFLIHFKPIGSLEEVISSLETALNIKSYELISSPSEKEPEKGENKAEQEKTKQEAVSQKQAAPAPTHDASSAKLSVATKQSLISVNQNKLDILMDITGEIVIAESMVASNPEVVDLNLESFNKSTRQLRKLINELQDVVMSIRMVPLSGVFQKMNRIVRDMNHKLGKEVELVIEGGDTEVDKTINDALGDPLMHMIRNSMDHAIESPEDRTALGKDPKGKVTLSARNIGGEIVITVADDGRGLKAEQILAKAKQNGLLYKAESEYSEKEIFGMIMLPGFSTKEKITEFSGRGVGMDVVRKNIEKTGGIISVESKLNEGSIFTIKIPLTLAIVDGMKISVGDTIFTMPIISIKQSFKLSDATPVIVNTDGSEMIMVRGNCYPIIRLHKVYGIEPKVTDLNDGILILVENEHKFACIYADELIGKQQVVVKPFPSFISRHNIKSRGVSGCTILGDGSISLILDTNNLLNKA